ncbi:MAG: Vanadium-dependent haloperoxidase [Ferruginibacter sp.]|nr:Vanadium-dependent haloperoxidase [Ferruginibacter sp.]
MRNILLAISICCLTGCVSKINQKMLDDFGENKLTVWNKKLTRVIITDVFSPPVCSRIYAYCNIAAYEVLVLSDSSRVSFAGKLNGLTGLPKPANIDQINFRVASIIAFTTVAQKLVFNTEAMKEKEDDYSRQLDSMGISVAVKNKTMEYGRAVGKHIIEWAAKDGYLQRNSNPAFLVTKDPARWKPTPPDYADAVEPNWGTVRPFVLTSSGQFRPGPPLHFDTSHRSEIYKEAEMVYNAVKNPGPQFTSIARYWDCNPNVSVTSGHVTYFQQQVSPGGHWMFIAGSVAEKEKYSAVKTAELLAKVAMSLADGFISCWEAKFKYGSLRPETYINQYIDKEWRPFIQTPPFPEYPSGHSVISSSAATMLTHIIGDNYVFIDSAEVDFGRPPKKFDSFHKAAQEASLSRLYGGIHFLKSLTISLEEGKNVAEFLIQKLK